MRKSWIVLTLITACTGTGGPTNSTTADIDEPASTISTAPGVITIFTSSTTTAPITTTTVAANGDIGTRANPYPLGGTVTVGDYLVTVTSVDPNGAEAILAENQFNDPPPEGSRFVLIGLHLVYEGNETGNAYFDLAWSGVGASNVASEDNCGVIPNDLIDVPEMFPGGAVDANICLTVIEGDLPDLLLILEELISFEDVRVFIDLGL